MHQTPPLRAAYHCQQDCKVLQGEHGPWPMAQLCLSDHLLGGTETRAGRSSPQTSHLYLTLRTSCYHKGPEQKTGGQRLKAKEGI